MIEWGETILRLGSATIIGGAIGINRDLHHKPSGLRTLAIVGLGSALATLTFEADLSSASRILQGLMTGIGFLGAGVILRHADSGKISGLTTAASIWATAGLGAACGLGAWRYAIVASVLMGCILVFGKQLERAIHRTFDGSGDDPHAPD